MPPLITLSGVTKAFGTRELFAGVSFRLDEGEKAALVGANGIGKTTLLAIIEGVETPDSGDIARGKLAVTSIMAQDLSNDETALSTALSVFAPLFAMEDELEGIARELCGDVDVARREKLIARQHALNERFADAGGLTCRSRARSSLLALGLSDAELLLPLKSLSGGQQAKVRLAMALLKAPSLLLLDEPTNHLDLAAIEWLEEFLVTTKSALLVVSHDRAFLDRVTTRTLELEEGRLFDYPVPYSAHIERRAARREAERRVYTNTRKEIERLEGIVEQQRRWNRERNIRMAESKMKMIERLEADLSKPAADPETLRLSFPIEAESGDDVLIATGLSKAFEQKRLFENVSLHIRKGERVVLVGGNGVGKTTLLRLLTGAPSDSGVVRLGANVRVGIYEQGQSSLVATRTALEEVHSSCPALTLTAVRNAMAAFLFRGDDVFKPVSVLSGGEKARVALLKLIFSGANFLLLDEPTNHLDAASREALENALAGYTGTVLAISHDRYFIGKLAGRVGQLTQSGLAFYPSLAQVPRERAQAVQAAPRGSDYAERKARSAHLRKLESQAEKSRARIETLECEISRMEDDLLHTGSDYEAAQSLSAALDAARIELDAAYAMWLEASEGLEGNNSI